MTTLSRGLLIAIEGIDGSGKSLLARSLHTILQEKNIPTVLTKEPGGTALGNMLRTVLQEGKVPTCAKAEYLLFAASRAQHFDEFIIPHLANKIVVISDRLADSSLVYQGHGRGLDLATLEAINAWAMNTIKPDITIYVSVDLPTAFTRIKERNEKLTAFEQEKKSFFEKLLYGFAQLYKNRADVLEIDGTLPAEKVAAIALEQVMNYIIMHNILS